MSVTVEEWENIYSADKFKSQAKDKEMKYHEQMEL